MFFSCCIYYAVLFKVSILTACNRHYILYGYSKVLNLMHLKNLYCNGVNFPQKYNYAIEAPY